MSGRFVPYAHQPKVMLRKTNPKNLVELLSPERNVLTDQEMQESLKERTLSTDVINMLDKSIRTITSFKILQIRLDQAYKSLQEKQVEVCFTVHALPDTEKVQNLDVSTLDIETQMMLRLIFKLELISLMLSRIVWNHYRAQYELVFETFLPFLPTFLYLMETFLNFLQPPNATRFITHDGLIYLTHLSHQQFSDIIDAFIDSKKLDKFINAKSLCSVRSMFGIHSTFFEYYHFMANKSMFKEKMADKCPICFDKIKEPVVHVECNSVFCSSCITQWRKQSKSCPMCRSVSCFITVVQSVMQKEVIVEEHLPISFVHVVEKLGILFENVVVYKCWTDTFSVAKCVANGVLERCLLLQKSQQYDSIVDFFDDVKCKKLFFTMNFFDYPLENILCY